MARPPVSPGLVSFALLATLVAPGSAAAASAGGNWPEWRGPLRTGESPTADPPLEWAEGKNVRWKLAIPGLGHGSPIVWGDLVLVTTAAPATKDPNALEFVVIAVERKDGKPRWRTVVHEEVPHEGTHQTNSYASASLVTDGRRLYAYFGSRGLFALDMNGKRLWEKQLGKIQTRNGFGEGASPALHGDTLVVTWDLEGPDFVVALDAASGRERWRKERDEPTTLATPLVITGEGPPQVVVAGTNRVVSYDLATGEERWRAGGLTANTIPSPVYADGIVYVTSGFRGNALQAIRVKDTKGEVTAAPALVFRYDRDTPYVPLPLLYRGQLYFLKSSDGAVVVLGAGPKLELLATNRLDDGFDASPAVVDREIYLRGRKHLYRISAD